jgi:hypothetical protein
MNSLIKENTKNEILAEITGINYTPYLIKDLEEFDEKSFNINRHPASCIVNIKKNRFAISKWISPKRTRSYPFERVYNTLGFSKKITVIPVIKDEGENGDRDFVQWDTISLMSLLDVYVIPAYYNKAEINTKLKGKITNQEFNNKYVKNKINEISNYCSSALHWNLNEIKNNLLKIVNKVNNSYNKISKNTGIRMHNSIGIKRFRNDLLKDASEFMIASRNKAKDAQNREIMTRQPKEVLASLSKARITIKNYLGGYYYLTTDEIKIQKNNIFLIEGKHSNNQKLPSISDIKDGLLKMILYCNLSSVTYNDISLKHIPILSLTSTQLKEKISSNDSLKIISDFIKMNNFNNSQKELINILFKEANKNKFIVSIKHAHL